MFSIKTTWVGMMLLQDRKILNGFRPPMVKHNEPVDITEAVVKMGIATREQAEEWVAEIAEGHGFNGINAAFTLTVEQGKEMMGAHPTIGGVKVGDRVEVLVHFSSRPTCWRWGVGKDASAVCNAVIEAVVDEQGCAQETRLVSAIRQNGTTFVTVASRCADGKETQSTGESNVLDSHRAAAEACLAALVALPPPDPTSLKPRFTF